VSTPIDPSNPQQPTYPAPGPAGGQPGGPMSAPPGRPAMPPPADPSLAGPPTVSSPVDSPSGPPPGFDTKGRVRRTRSSDAWVALITGAVFLILLVIFIAQNSGKVSIKFLGFNGHMSLGLTVLISAVVGLLVAALPGTIRILQLRRALKQNARPRQRSGR
jgi:lipopolysaccharide assembly protein A